MRLSRTATALAAAGAFALPMLAPRVAAAQINIGGANPLTYSQNFDSLAASGTGLTFTNEVTIPGLYATRPTYSASNGSVTGVGLYSFGGGSSNPDRALGAQSGTTAIISYGFRFVNTGTEAITNFALSYDGEFWRNANTLTSSESLFFDYAVFGAGGGSIDGAGYTNVESLTFTVATRPSLTTGSSSPIETQSLNNGTGTAITVNPGQELWLRWQDTDYSSSDHGTGVDNVNITFSATTALPEPGTFALMKIGLPLLGLVALRKRFGKGRKQRNKFPS